MATIKRYKRKLLTFLIGLIGGSGLLYPFTPDARAKERGVSPLIPDARTKERGIVSPYVPDSRTKERSVVTKEMEVSQEVSLREQILIQQQEILLNMQELKLMMEGLDIKLRQIESLQETK